MNKSMEGAKPHMVIGIDLGMTVSTSVVRGCCVGASTLHLDGEKAGPITARVYVSDSG